MKTNEELQKELDIIKEKNSELEKQNLLKENEVLRVKAEKMVKETSSHPEITVSSVTRNFGLVMVPFLQILGFITMLTGYNKGEGGTAFGIGAIMFYILSIPFVWFRKQTNVLVKIVLLFMYFGGVYWIISADMGHGYSFLHAVELIYEKSF